MTLIFCCWFKTKIHTNLLIIRISFKNFLKISHYFDSVIILIVSFEFNGFLLEDDFLFLIFVLRLTFLITLNFRWLRFNGIRIVICTLFIIPATKFIEKKLKIIIIKFKTNDFVIFYDFSVLIETRIWLRWH